uniref:WAP domain-containing protein n=1 Tax=Salvator merianae TaxID=96440 RepID=A0A8D0C6A2_SALMN
MPGTAPPWASQLPLLLLSAAWPSCVAAKPGGCPLLLRGSLGPCPELAVRNCSSDLDCAGKKKCCSVGCSRVCREPVEDKPGSCPTYSVIAPLAICRSNCDMDHDCRDDFKCCRNGCGYLTCTRPR